MDGNYLSGSGLSIYFVAAMKNIFRTISFTIIFVTNHAVAGTLAWFYALDQDKAAFEAEVGPPLRTATSGSTSFHEYQVGPHRVVAARMDSGCVETAVSVATVLALNPASRILSTGPAGGIGEEATVGTWFRVDKVAPWQKGRAESGGKTTPPAPIIVPFEANEWPEGKWHELSGTTTASGEAFIASSDVGAEIRTLTNSSLVEMNALGLLTAVEGRSAKILLLRTVSDRADENASADFAAFAKNYDGNGGKMIAELVRKLPPDKDEPGSHKFLKELLE